MCIAADLEGLLSRDHERLDTLLDVALRDDGTVDEVAYSEFRSGLLRHIGIEERLLFPEVRKRQGRSAIADQLHRDHAALAALLVPPPDAVQIGRIRALLEEHNPLEEGPDGLYRQVQALAGGDVPKLVAAIEVFPAIPVAPYADTPLLRQTIEQLLREAEAGRRSVLFGYHTAD